MSVSIAPSLLCLYLTKLIWICTTGARVVPAGDFWCWRCPIIHGSRVGILKSLQEGRSVRVYLGVVKNINCVCDLNKSLSGAEGDVGWVKKVNLTLMTVFIRFYFQLSELKPPGAPSCLSTIVCTRVPTYPAKTLLVKITSWDESKTRIRHLLYAL